VLSTTDADGIVTKTTYDNAGRVTLTDVGGKQTTSTYDAAGDLVSQTDPTGATVAGTYDVFGRKIEEKHSLGTTTLKDTLTTYDYASRVTGVTRTAGAGVSEADTYSMGLLAGSTLGYGATTSTVSYDAGNVTEHSRTVTASDAAAFTRTVNAYDAAKRATDTSVTGGLSMSVHREFDGGGHQKAQSGTGLSAPAAYTYADDGRKSRETLPFSLGGSIDASYTYTSDGRLNAVCGSGAGAFGYDSAGD
jgi:YD repeat-containing protein